MNEISGLLTGMGDTGLTSLTVYAANIAAALILGMVFSLVVQWKSAVSRSFALTIALLPPVVCVIFMLVNGSLGAGVAVMGAFSLVRFRSLPGSGREITALFIAMAIGLTCGMGNLPYALVFSGIIILALAFLEQIRFGELFSRNAKRVLIITIPEDLNYGEVFRDVLERHTRRYNLTMVRTTNMGSLFKLHYDVDLRNPGEEKVFLDELRVRNGNLEISCALASQGNGEL